MRALVVAILSVLAVSCDPQHEKEIDALGGETPGIPRGPTHRAGQPCLVCHGERGPEGPTMSVAGTVFRSRTDRTGVLGATVTLTDATGVERTFGTNEVGTFYVEAKVWSPVFPLRTKVTLGALTAEMKTPINEDGACGSCHRDPAARDSVGHIFLEPDDAGVAP